MKVYTTQEIRNLGIVGHGDAGKTSLVAAMLYATGVGNRLGRVDDGTAPTDFDEEEIFDSADAATIRAHFRDWAETVVQPGQQQGDNGRPPDRTGRSPRDRHRAQVDAEAITAAVCDVPPPLDHSSDVGGRKVGSAWW